MKFFTKCLMALFLMSGGVLYASIVNTKHNLSTTNMAGTVKAQTETEICVFCHIPHVSRPDGTPLWNRSMPSSSYTMYDSDYLRRMGYPDVALDLGTANDTPGALSRQCLSCHDGTVAVGAVYKLRRTTMGTNTIAMSGVEADGTVPATAAGFLGTDLTMHHPVGIEYDATVTKNFSIGSRTIELKASPAAPIKLFEYGGKKYVECSSCHDPHKDNKKFLHFDTGTNHAQNVVGTCTSCHDKLNWTGSIHQSATATYSDVGVLTTYGTNKVSDLGCANCHTPHNAEGIPYLNRKVQGNTCFQGASADIVGAACHGVGGAKDMQTVLNRTYKHPVVASSDGTGPQHTNLDVLYGTGITDPNGGKGISWDTNQHAVCMDCHNPHKAQAGTHVPPGQWYPSTPTNAVSNVLQGVSGVQPSWPAEWTQPTTFETYESALYEYQICFKCHSYWGVGGSTDGRTGYVSASGAQLTDVAWEMNKNNKSGHPVVISASQRAGTSYEPKALDPVQLVDVWQANPGGNVMYCSDCHGSDQELNGDPRGPHGSNLKYLLKGQRQFWPVRPDGLLYTMDDIGESGTRDLTGDGIPEDDRDLFCNNCHDANFPHSDEWRNAMANRGFQCVQCHLAVPHGSSVSRLLGYYNFPAPYNYNGNTLKMTGYRKNDPLNVYNRDVYSPACGGGNNCHNSDNSATSPYDKNVLLPVQDVAFTR